MDMERQKQLWEEEEEEEEEDQLERRRDHKSTVQPPVNGEANAGNEHAEPEQNEESNRNNHNHAIELEQNGDEATPTRFHNNSIYFDSNQGNESADGVSGMQYSGLDSSVLETNSKDEELHIKATEFDIQRSAEINHHHQKDSGDEILPCSSPSPAKELAEENSINLEDLDNKTGADTDVSLIQGNDQEFTEFDVEKVLEKQSTHELYCPNCNSCITRRVILRRKKPKVPKIPHRPKRDKSETHFASAGNTVNAGNDQHDDTLIIHSNDSPVPAANDENLDRQPDIFRCLSCFSFFIRTGNGIKHFRASRYSNDTGEMQDVQNLPLPRTNWFFSIFQSDNRKPAVDQGNRAPRDSEVDGIRGPAKGADIKSQQDGLESLNSMTSLEKPLLGIDQETNIPMKNETLVDPNGFDLPVEAVSSQNESSIGVGLVNGATSKTQETQKGALTASAAEQIRLNGILSYVGEKLDSAVDKDNTGNDLIVVIQTPPVQPASSQRTPNVDISPEAEIDVGQNTGVDAREVHHWDVLKSIVYGGLLESITSLGVVSSAAAAGAATLDILAMGLANLMGGLFIIFHNVRELKNDRSGETTSPMNKQEDRYQQLLGRRENFALHATVVVLSFLTFGVLPPVIYGFSFRKSDNRGLKFVAVAGSSLVCIILLAFGKAHVQKPPRQARLYFTTILYYVMIGLTTLGLSYAVGDLVKKLFEQLNLFKTTSDVTLPFLETNLKKARWALY